MVGASASGTQIAHEIQRSGRPVTLSVGEHIRAPRMYRGKDIQWWMDAAGVLDERYDEVDDIARARRVPSLQLAGTPDRSTLDLNALTDIGVRLVGRLAGIARRQGAVRGLAAQHVRALRSQDEPAAGHHRRVGVARTASITPVEPPHRLPPTRIEESPALSLDLATATIKTIIWATGYRPDYSWLELPVLDRKGRVRHDGGVADLPGLYLMGLHFMRRRKSTLIDGAGDDARDLSAHLAAYLDGQISTSGRADARHRLRSRSEVA